MKPVLIISNLKCRLKSLLLTVVLIGLVPPLQLLHAQAVSPFTPTHTISYLTHSTVAGGASALYKINLISGSKTLIASLSYGGNPIHVNAIGYNALDNYIYGAYAGNGTSAVATNDIVQIDSSGNVSVIDVPALPTARYLAGDVDNLGRLHLYVPSATKLYRVNLSTLAVDTITLSTGYNLSDIAVSGSGNRIRGISASNSDYCFYAVTGTTGTGTAVASGLSAGGTSALSFYDSRFNFFSLSSTTGNVYLTDKSYGTTLKVAGSTAETLFDADGAQPSNVSVFNESQPTFSCEDGVGYVYSQTSDNMYEINAGIASYSVAAFDINANAAGEYNNMGFNVKDGYLWMHRQNTRFLARIGSDFSVQYFPIPTLPGAQTFNAGEVDTNGIFYLMDGSASSGTKTIYKVDLNPASATYLEMVGSVTTSISTGTLTDLGFNSVDDLLYGVTAGGNLIRINPVDGTTTNLGATGIGVTDGFVIAFMDDEGTLYLQASGSSTMYEITGTQDGNTTATVFETGVTAITSGDGARCAVSDFNPTPLPVTLISFVGHAQGCEATLNWQIAPGGDISYFEIASSSDGKQFAKVGQVQWNPDQTNYSFKHASNAATTYYRLKMVERDNTYQASAVVKVETGCNPSKINIYPNPATDQVRISNLGNNSSISVFDPLGRKVYAATATGIEQVIDISTWAKGIYIVEIRAAGTAPVSLKVARQ